MSFLFYNGRKAESAQYSASLLKLHQNQEKKLPLLQEQNLPKLTIEDIENALCEFSKWARSSKVAEYPAKNID